MCVRLSVHAVVQIDPMTDINDNSALILVILGLFPALFRSLLLLFPSLFLLPPFYLISPHPLFSYLPNSLPPSSVLRSISVRR
jgi:hypothetical protein